MMNCIFCEDEILKSSIEHIVPESLGNIWYTLPSGCVCNKCNGNFSKFEHKAIQNTQLGVARTINGIKTKKGNPSSFQIGNIKGEGLKSSEKNVLTFYGVEEKDIIETDKENRIYKILVPDFHKSEMATSKFLLKIAYESIFKSQKKILSDYNLVNLKRYLLKLHNDDWPFLLITTPFHEFKSIPTFSDKHNLNRIRCKLLIAEVSDKILLFNFRYGFVSLVINLLDRDYSWTKIYFEKDNMPGLYPKYLVK